MLPVGGGQDGRVRFLFSLNGAAARSSSSVHSNCDGVLAHWQKTLSVKHTKVFSGNFIQLKVTMAWIFLFKPDDRPVKMEMEPL